MAVTASGTRPGGRIASASGKGNELPRQTALPRAPGAESPALQVTLVTGCALLLVLLYYKLLKAQLEILPVSEGLSR